MRVEDAVAEATRTNAPVKTEHLGTPILARPGESIELVQTRWHYERLLVQVALGVIRVEDLVDTELVTREKVARRSVENGDVVEMTGIMRDDPDPIPVGERGVVLWVRNRGTRDEQIDVRWTSGRGLMLLPQDPFRVVTAPFDSVSTT